MVNVKDLIAGGALFALGAAMAIAARGFPTVGAMAYGPGLFPTIIACGLMVTGLAIAVENLSGSKPKNSEAEAGGEGRPLPMFGVLAVIAFFALTLDFLGFHIAAAISLLVSVRLFRGGWATALAVAVIGAALFHVLFYSILRVPLPWGLLLPVAW